MNNNEPKYYEKISEDFCGICYEYFDGDITTQVYCSKCPNTYHQNCMASWKLIKGDHRKKCPYCSRKTLKYPKKVSKEVYTYCCWPFNNFIFALN